VKRPERYQHELVFTRSAEKDLALLDQPDHLEDLAVDVNRLAERVLDAEQPVGNRAAKNNNIAAMDRVAVANEASPINHDAGGVGEEVLDAAHDRTLSLFTLIPNSKRLKRHLGVERTDNPNSWTVGSNVHRIVDGECRAPFEECLKVGIPHIRKAHPCNDQAARVESRKSALYRTVQALDQRNHHTHGCNAHDDSGERKR